MSTPTRDTLVQALTQLNALQAQAASFQAQAASVQRALEAALQSETAGIPLIDLQVKLASAPTPEPDWTTLERAAVSCKIHPDTMAARAHKNGLGRKIGRSWMIDLNRVRAWETGQPYDPLPQA
jgi:hypothetical protein